MPHLHAKTISLIAGAILSQAMPASVSAQEAQDKAFSTGQFIAIAEFCGVPSPEMLALFKQRQKTAATQSGMTPEAFDAAFARSHKKALGYLAEYSEEEKEVTCQPLRAMANQ